MRGDGGCQPCMTSSKVGAPRLLAEGPEFLAPGVGISRRTADGTEMEGGGGASYTTEGKGRYADEPGEEWSWRGTGGVRRK